MKSKRFLILIALLLLFAICLASCDLGSYSETAPKPNAPQTPQAPQNPQTPPQDGDNPPSEEDKIEEYTASVYYGNALLTSQRGVSVVWQNEIEQISIPLGADGKASAGELDGDYSVRLAGLPDKYAYNPNIYRVTADSKHIDIFVYDVSYPISGDGNALFVSEGCYYTTELGYYRAMCLKNRCLFYEFEPALSGKYVVESHVDIAGDIINPLLEIYGSNANFKKHAGDIDSGGDYRAGGYTKNFRWEINVSEQEVGVAYTFGVAATSKLEQYPVAVTFSIKYLSEADDPYHTDYNVIGAEQISNLPSVGGDNYVFADLGTYLFSGKNVRFNERTGLYHIYSLAAYPNGADPSFGAGYGPYLCCQIIKASPCYTLTTLYNANLVGDDDWEDEYKYNFLDITIINPKGGYINNDYTAFVRVEYAGVCNADGVCPVTKELKDFLQAYAIARELWTDNYNPVEYTPESNGYQANQDDLWLFACGFYEDDDSLIAILIADREA